VGFYDPIKNQTYLNVPAILYFLEKGAQPTETVQDILKKAEVFKEFRKSSGGASWFRPVHPLKTRTFR